jgi:hypothetical protein
MTVVAKVLAPLPPAPISSGTVSSTIIDTIKVIEHAVRRAGVAASMLTPEQLDTAYDNLYLILTSMVNRGINLWCLENVIIGLNINQAKYPLPSGTIDITGGARYRTIVPIAATWTQLAQVKTGALAAPSSVRTVGVRFGSEGTYNIAVEVLLDDNTWKTARTLALTTKNGQWSWFNIDPAYTGSQFRLRETNGIAFQTQEIVVAHDTNEVPMTPYNRDAYHAITNKNVSGRPLNYLMEKQLPPILTLWPVPNDPYAQIVVTRQRQVQDVGALLSKLEIPERWFECIIWMLAKNMAFELPGVTPERITMCISQADNALREAELGETDGQPLYIQPNISGYTR